MNVSEQFSLLSEELCSHLYVKEYDKGKINALIDDLNSKPYKSEIFVCKEDAAALMTSLCFNIKPVDEFLSAKTSHLLNSLVTKQNVQFNNDFLYKVIAWHIECMKICSDIILPDILHNLQCILQTNPQSGHKFINDLIGDEGFLTNLIDNDYRNMNKNSFQLCLIALKCVTCLLTIDENKLNEQENISLDIKDYWSQLMINFLLKDYSKCQDESMYCKKVSLPMSEVIGICRHFILHGLIIQGHPEKIMPAQQSIAAEPVKIQPKGGKKQKIRKHRNHAIESLKKEIPVSDHSLMKDVKSFDSSYTPASDFLEPLKPRASWAMTSDSDMSDIENGREAKLIALRSRVRQGASNLFLIVFKIKEKKDIFGYWWALLPDSPETDWLGEEKSKKTLAYCALIDPVATSRASALSVILALLSGSRIYLSQAETSKKNISFIPFSVSLGYIITCLHKLLCSILESERSHAVVIVALKCTAALVQATPYQKMQEGLITAVVRSTRKFLVHRDVTLQVASLITIGCVLSVDPKVEEMLKAMEKDTVPYKIHQKRENVSLNDECDDFEEGYSDDEMFTEPETVQTDENNEYEKYYFKSWILDICFKNMGWLCKNNEIIRCKPSTIPIVLESLQVLSAISFHHFSDLLHSHTKFLGEVLSGLLQHEHQDVVLQAARTISVIGDALQRLEQQDQAPSSNECVSMWEKLLPPLSSVLQNHENAPAKAVVCDCIANIGEKSFKHIPARSQRLCCALLVGSCGGEEAGVRAAAVRALAMAVMYRTLREDVCFVSDCGENILRALAEPSLVVRTKAAWALGNLSDALVLNMDDPEIEDIDDDLLIRLLEVSVQCAGDNDKIKMSATRGLGNLLRLIKNENLQRHPRLKALCETALEKLLACACKVTNMKVRWNACYAIGNALKNEELFTFLTGWQSSVFPALCNLAQHCKNFKVRTQAACALRVSRPHCAHHCAALWRAVLAAMDSAAHDHDHDRAEHVHRDNLIEQLCVTLSHLCCILKPSDLSDVLEPLIFHFECAKALFSRLYHKLPPENPSCLKMLEAAKHVTAELTRAPPLNDAQAQCVGMLQDIFIFDV